MTAPNEHPLDAQRRRTNEMAEHLAAAKRHLEAFGLLAIDPHNPNEWRNAPSLALLHMQQLGEVADAVAVIVEVIAPDEDKR